MRGRLLTLLLLLGVTAGCHDTQGSEALLALVKLHEAQAANCIVLEVLTPEGAVLHTERVPRAADKQELRIALFREQLPEEVELQARPVWSPDCKAPAQQGRPNGPVSVKVRGRFVQGGGRAELLVGPPENDTDEDGFADQADGGPDCADDRKDRNPAAAEVCNAIEDRNCDALRGCDDPTCAAPGCTPVPSQLAFTDWLAEVDAGSCAGPFTVVRQDAQERVSTIAEESAITLQASATAAFYPDARCATPISSLLLGKGVGSAQFYLSSQRLGALNVTASASGLGPAIGPLEIVIGPTRALVFAPAPPTTTADACSAPFALQRQDSLGNAVTDEPELPVTFTVPANSQLQFFADDTCTSAVSTVSIPQGQSLVTLRFKGKVAGTLPVMVSASGVDTFQQLVTVTAGTASVLRFATTPPQTVLAGACSTEFVVRTEDVHGNATNPASPSLTLATVPASRLTFYSDSTCQTPLGAPTLSGGQLRFYAKGQTGGAVTLRATHSNLGETTLGHTLLPTVRTGTCTLGAADTTVDCPIQPALLDRNRTFFVFQATPNGDAPSNAYIRCHLPDASRLTCTRAGSGVDAAIRWQTAEFPASSGVRVQHINDVACAPANTTSVSITPVTSADTTFVLFSALQDGATVSVDDLFAVQLVGTNRVDVVTSGGCYLARYAFQVVEYPGARVTRGVTGSMSSRTLTVQSLSSVDRSRTFLLYSARSTAGSVAICDRMIRGDLNANTEVTFTRGLGSGSCDNAAVDAISWERIELPANNSVQEVTVDLSQGTASNRAGVSSVDTTRTLVFSGSQNFSGQAGGETNYATNDIIGVALGLHQLTSATELEVSRSNTSEAARWNSYVLQLSP